MSKEPISLACDIVILPTPELAQKALAASQELQQFGTLFTLQEGVCFPHASLYMTQLKVSDLDRTKELLAAIAAKTPVLNLIATQMPTQPVPATCSRKAGDKNC